jgi:hypothetical protein
MVQHLDVGRNDKQSPDKNHQQLGDYSTAPLQPPVEQRPIRPSLPPLTMISCSQGKFLLRGAIMKIRLIVLASTLAVASCAKRPDAIVPVDIPMAAFSNQGCEGLAQDNLASLSKQQNQAATGDAFGVFLLGVPASSALGGDKEGQVAVSKGKVNAIENTMKSKGCK